ncbi:MAG: DUF4870 domain-containing protein [Candidatus Cybelea sp.]|jgi:uncharacterized Tic20 family protein
MQTQIGSQERNWGMAAHLSALVAVVGLPFGHVLGPLIVYLIKARESEFVAQHARASLNYQITISIAAVIGIIIAVGAGVAYAVAGHGGSDDSVAGAAFAGWWIAIGLAVLLVLLLSVIFIIAGTVAASEGKPYTYPFAIRFLR